MVNYVLSNNTSVLSKYFKFSLTPQGCFYWVHSSGSITGWDVPPSILLRNYPSSSGFQGSHVTSQSETTMKSHSGFGIQTFTTLCLPMIFLLLTLLRIYWSFRMWGLCHRPMEYLCSLLLKLELNRYLYLPCFLTVPSFYNLFKLCSLYRTIVESIFLPSSALLCASDFLS